jgi:hypothetical protein
MSPMNLNRLVQRPDLFRYVDGYQYIRSFVSVLMKDMAGGRTLIGDG